MRYVPQHLLTAALFAVGIFAVSTPTASAGECDLYTTSATCLFNDGSTNGGSTDTAIFQVLQDPYSVQPTGTGYIDSFLRVQMKGYEEGFNTDVRPVLCDDVECDVKTDPNFTNSLLLSAVPIVTIDGVDYRQFFLDINEPYADPKSYITLDQIEIYTSMSATLYDYQSENGGSLTGGTKIFDLDTATNNIQPYSDNWLNLNYGVMSGGSGVGDMVMYIPDSYFGAYKKNTYVYLYSQFGCIGTGNYSTCGAQQGGVKWDSKYASQAGFEEWWAFAQTPPGGGGGGVNPVPEPASLTLLATGLAIAARKRFGRKDAAKSSR